MHDKNESKNQTLAANGCSPLLPCSRVVQTQRRLFIDNVDFVFNDTDATNRLLSAVLREGFDV